MLPPLAFVGVLLLLPVAFITLYSVGAADEHPRHADGVLAVELE